jgi:hypothetical protein
VKDNPTRVQKATFVERLNYFCLEYFSGMNNIVISKADTSPVAGRI